MAFLPSEEYVGTLRVGDPDELRLLQGDLTEYPADTLKLAGTHKSDYSLSIGILHA